MKTKLVNKIPTNFKELNEENTKVLEDAQKLEVGQILEVEPEEGKQGKLLVTGFKNAVKRLEPKTFKFRVRNNCVYVQRTDGLEE